MKSDILLMHHRSNITVLVCRLSKTLSDPFLVCLMSYSSYTTQLQHCRPLSSLRQEMRQHLKTHSFNGSFSACKSAAYQCSSWLTHLTSLYQVMADCCCPCGLPQADGTERHSLLAASLHWHLPDNCTCVCFEF